MIIMFYTGNLFNVFKIINNIKNIKTICETKIKNQPTSIIASSAS